MNNFVKLFNSILASSIWSEPNATRILWITMLAMSDKDGVVSSSVPGLARFAGLSVEETREGLKTFLSPDPDSGDKDRNPNNNGVRIEKVDGGWRLINHAHYRALMSKDERKEYNRKKQAEHRARVKAGTEDDEIP